MPDGCAEAAGDESAQAAELWDFESDCGADVLAVLVAPAPAEESDDVEEDEPPDSPEDPEVTEPPDELLPEPLPELLPEPLPRWLPEAALRRSLRESLR